MITNFSIWKNEDKKEDKQPDYRVATNIDGNFVEIAVGWKKVSKDGKNYISCTLSKRYHDKPGYEIKEVEKAEQDADEML